MPSTSVSLRRPRPNDLLDIEEIASKSDYPLVDKFHSAALIESNGKPTMFAVIKNVVEAVIYASGTKREIGLGLSKLIEQGKKDSLRIGMQELYVFAKDEEFAGILIKHFGFRRAQGVPLILDLEREDAAGKEN